MTGELWLVVVVVEKSVGWEKEGRVENRERGRGGGVLIIIPGRDLRSDADC